VIYDDGTTLVPVG